MSPPGPGWGAQLYDDLLADVLLEILDGLLPGPGGGVQRFGKLAHLGHVVQLVADAVRRIVAQLPTT